MNHPDFRRLGDNLSFRLGMATVDRAREEYLSPGVLTAFAQECDREIATLTPILAEYRRLSTAGTPDVEILNFMNNYRA